MTKVPRFIRRLYDALEANNYDFLKWDESGRAFLVDYQKLKGTMIFGKTTVATVIKQLNNYGFKLIKRITKYIKIYSHEIFNQGEKYIVIIKKKRQNLVKLHRISIRQFQKPQEDTLEYLRYENLELHKKVLQIKENQNILFKQLILNQKIYISIANMIYNIYRVMNCEEQNCKKGENCEYVFYTFFNGFQQKQRDILTQLIAQVMQSPKDQQLDVDFLKEYLHNQIF